MTVIFSLIDHIPVFQALLNLSTPLLSKIISHYSTMRPQQLPDYGPTKLLHALIAHTSAQALPSPAILPWLGQMFTSIQTQPTSRAGGCPDGRGSQGPNACQLLAQMIS